VLPSEQQNPLLPGVQEASETTQQLVDQEVRRIVDEAHEDVTRLLTDHREKLDSLTEALLRDETLDQDAAYAAAGVSMPAALPVGTPALSASRPAALEVSPAPADHQGS
jgi:cell division protease FtsH